MEIFQTIWTALSTPNERLIQLIGIPFTFIEAYVYMLLFTTVLNISSTKKQKYEYVILFSILVIFINYFIPKKYSVFLIIPICPILAILIFKTNIIKGVLSEILPLVVNAVLESLILKIYLLVFNVSYDEVAIIPLYREAVVLTAYLCIFLLYKLSQKLHLNINSLDNMDKKSKWIFIANLIIGIIAIAIQLFLSGFYNENLPFFVTILSVITLLTYFFTSLYSLSRVTKLQITTQSLEEAKLYNKSLKILHDNVRSFKHDFSNIVQSIRTDT